MLIFRRFASIDCQSLAAGDAYRLFRCPLIRANYVSLPRNYVYSQALPVIASIVAGSCW